MDFKKATELFRDPDFDGEPVVIYEPDDDDDPVPPDPEPTMTKKMGDDRRPAGTYKVRVSGVPARIIAERVEYIGPDGTLITESYRDFTRKQINPSSPRWTSFCSAGTAPRKSRPSSTCWKSTASCWTIWPPKSARTMAIST
jgi:hypothetical protein